MVNKTYPCYLANKPIAPNHDLEVTDKYSGEVVSRVPLVKADMINSAIESAVNAQAALRVMPPFERQRVLLHCVTRFEERKDELAFALCVEAGKPINDSRGEVTRLIDTFRVAAEESVRINGEALNLEISERARGYWGMTQRVPIGPCSFISPFNFPLNLAAHKIAPAVAAGCPFVLKPASRTPIGALVIGEVLAETDLPEGAFSILPCRRDGAELFTEDERFKLLSFTGSPSVGWDLKARAGKKKVVLELGGNAACVVHSDADIDDAVARLVKGAFYQSGQSCISVQRIMVHEDSYAQLRDAFVEKVANLRAGDPKDEGTFIGPMISESAAAELEGKIQAACSAGAKVLCGGERSGAMLQATVLEGAPKDSDIVTTEAFGPVAILSSYRTFEEALAEVNDSNFGLQAGIFTSDIGRIRYAWDTLDVGGVLINEVPSWRVDNMPYGGVKDSGLGREGVRYAIEDMTEIRLMVVRSIQ